jgi:uncharacterized protein (DUF58 family)
MRRAWSALRKRLGERSRRWARRRQGPDAARITLTSQRIYILPTASGLVYAAMLATMLAGAMNYNNNLAFALTFLLAGLGIVTIYHTHRTLTGLHLNYLGAQAVFAGDPLDVRFGLVNDAAQAREEIFLDWPGSAEVPGGVAALDSRTIALPLATARRGPLALPPLRISTRAPLGLTRAWTWVHLQERPIVYPRPAARAVAGDGLSPARLASGNSRRGEDDFAGLRSYQPGDSPRRIAWKSYARSGELLARAYRGGGHEEPLWIDWAALPPSDTETRVARLARLVIDAFESGRAWGLRGPGIRIEPSGGREQMHRCLRALATVALPESAAS